MENAAGDLAAALLLGPCRVLGAQTGIHEAAHLLIHPYSLLKTLGGRHAPVDRGLPFVGFAQMIGSGRHAVDRKGRREVESTPPRVGLRR
jgi:hypothetical protein